MYVKIEEGKIYANNYVIANLTQPFRKILNQKKVCKGDYYFNRHPSETLSGKRMRDFPIHLRDCNYGFLYRAFAQKIKCHGIYHTNSHIQKALRLHALERLNAVSSVTPEIRTQFVFYLTKILNYIISSYDFEIMITDSIIPGVLIPQIRGNWGFKATIYPYQTILDVENITPQIIMLSTIDYSIIKKYERILIFSMFNRSYSGELTKAFSKYHPTKEILPLVGFVL